MTDQPVSTAPAAAAHPLVQGRCPACNSSSLFLGSGGYVTCSRLDCTNPCAADDLLHRGRPEPGQWITEGTHDLRIPEFTARPVTPEMERAATERARQAAADSERSAEWFAQHSSPREHCGHLAPTTLLTTRRTECVLRPSHSGSHADDRGCRWWYDPTAADELARTTPNNEPPPMAS